MMIPKGGEVSATFNLVMTKWKNYQELDLLKLVYCNMHTLDITNHKIIDEFK